MKQKNNNIILETWITYKKIIIQVLILQILGTWLVKGMLNQVHSYEEYRDIPNGLIGSYILWCVVFILFMVFISFVLVYCGNHQIPLFSKSSLGYIKKQLLRIAIAIFLFAIVVMVGWLGFTLVGTGIFILGSAYLNTDMAVMKDVSRLVVTYGTTFIAMRFAMILFLGAYDQSDGIISWANDLYIKNKRFLGIYLYGIGGIFATLFYGMNLFLLRKEEVFSFAYITIMALVFIPIFITYGTSLYNKIIDDINMTSAEQNESNLFVSYQKRRAEMSLYEKVKQVFLPVFTIAIFTLVFVWMSTFLGEKKEVLAELSPESFDAFIMELTLEEMQEDPLKVVLFEQEYRYDLSNLNIEYQLNYPKYIDIGLLIYNDTSRLEKLNAYDITKLDEQQQEIYQIMENKIKARLETDKFYNYKGYIKPMDNGIEEIMNDIIAIQVKDLDDIKMKLSFFQQLPTYFTEMLTYEQSRCNVGMSVSNDMYDKVLESLDLLQGDLLRSKEVELEGILDAIAGIPSAEREVANIEKVMNNLFDSELPQALERFKLGIYDLKSKTRSTGNASKWELGDKYYEALLFELNQGTESVLDIEVKNDEKLFEVESELSLLLSNHLTIDNDINPVFKELDMVFNEKRTSYVEDQNSILAKESFIRVWNLQEEKQYKNEMEVAFEKVESYCKTSNIEIKLYEYYRLQKEYEWLQLIKQDIDFHYHTGTMQNLRFDMDKLYDNNKRYEEDMKTNMFYDIMGNPGRQLKNYLGYFY